MRHASRRRRRALFLRTARARPATRTLIPRRLGSSARARLSATTRSPSQRPLRPCRRIRAQSLALLMERSLAMVIVARSARSGRKAGAALGAPSLQDGAPGTGFHAGAKTVLALAATVVGLVSPLGHRIFPFRVSPPTRSSLIAKYAAASGVPRQYIQDAFLHVKATTRNLLDQPDDTA